MPASEEIIFTKMHGIGNDYIYINCLDRCPADIAALSVEMSDRHCGVGGDGIILILPSDVADFKMRIFNADGSEARMCGNGSRCVGKYVYDRGLTDKTEITLETLSGIKRLQLHVDNGKVSEVTVDMGVPGYGDLALPVATAADGEMRVTPVSMGNPHGVVVVDDLAAINFDVTGPELEHHSMWDDRANIEFAQILSPEEIRVRVWERGSGETLACGTGACATAVACCLLGHTGRRVTIKLRGGDLGIEWGADGHVYMRGSATTVFDGRYMRLRK